MKIAEGPSIAYVSTVDYCTQSFARNLNPVSCNAYLCLASTRHSPSLGKSSISVLFSGKATQIKSGAWPT